MHTTKIKSSLGHLISLCIALTMFQACDVDDLGGLNYETVANYGTFLGDPNYKDVIIYSQGANPSITLNDTELVELLKPVNTNGIIIANIRQQQVVDPWALQKDHLEAHEALEMNNQSVDDLVTVIRHFKNQGKTVNVMGSGFGGFVVQKLIADHGSEIADSYLILGSRISIEESFSEAWIQGRNLTYDHNTNPAGLLTGSASSEIDANLNRLFGHISSIDYLDKLQSEDLSNMTYVFSSKDEVVGRLNIDEQNFLRNKEVQVIETSGNHNDGLKEGISEAMRLAFDIE